MCVCVCVCVYVQFNLVYKSISCISRLLIYDLEIIDLY